MEFFLSRTGVDEYIPKYRSMFPEAVIRFKQLGYSEAVNPIEVRLSGDDMALLQKEAERVTALLRAMPQLNLVRTNYNEPLAATRITLDEDISTRLGISNSGVETTFAMRYGSGVSVGTVWEGDYDIPVMLKSIHADSADITNVRDELIPVAGGMTGVPLRQVAKVEPSWENGQIVRRNGVRTITVVAETERGVNAMQATADVQRVMEENPVADGITVTYGGEFEENEEQMPNIMAAVVIAIIIIFFILVFHFKRITTATLLLTCLSLCLFGTVIGVMVQGVDFGVTCVLGIVSLMGILVRNGIIMIDYAEELRREEKMNVHDAIYHSAQRRMRPIFLTSAAASMGVIPMILGGSGLWMLLKNGIMGGVTLTQPVFAGGQIVNGNKLAVVGVEMSKVQKEQSENEVHLTVEQYYWQVVTLQEQLATLHTVERQLESLSKDVEASVNAGITTMSDLLDAQTMFRQSRDKYVEAYARFQIKTVEYLQATGR